MTAVKLSEEVKADLRGLPSEELRVVAFQWLSRLRREPYLGQSLAWRASGDLSECRKIYFDEDDEPLRHDFIDRPVHRREEGARFRIVYRIRQRSGAPEQIDVIAIGSKVSPGDGVYRRAVNRLGGLGRLLRGSETP